MEDRVTEIEELRIKAAVRARYRWAHDSRTVVNAVVQEGRFVFARAWAADSKLQDKLLVAMLGEDDGATGRNVLDIVPAQTFNAIRQAGIAHQINATNAQLER